MEQTDELTDGRIAASLNAPYRRAGHYEIFAVMQGKDVFLIVSAVQVKLRQMKGEELKSDVDRVELFRLTLRFFDDVATAS